ncbi:MAG: hypothetical protein GYA24_00595 [Candidatus Lokiarchaeota archaeon]|nr:hypothetical protein [Candidatus Lokiarchaeota archaeon]
MRQFRSRALVATENAKFFHFISKELSRDRFKFTHLRPADVSVHKCPRDAVIITTRSEVGSLPPELLILSYDETEHPLNERNVQEFYHLFRVLMDTGIDACSQIDIGIDPGSKHTGLAVFLNGTFIEATVIPTSEAMTREFIGMAIATGLHGCKENATPSIRVKIGNGSPVDMHKIIGLLLRMQQQHAIEIMIVDESGSNSEFSIAGSTFIKIADHARAAVNIALREGLGLDEARRSPEFQAGTRKYLTRKQVKSIQAESRLASGGEPITIDQHLATQVLLGKMTLQEAIDLYKQGGKGKPAGTSGTGTT